MLYYNDQYTLTVLLEGINILKSSSQYTSITLSAYYGYYYMLVSAFDAELKSPQVKTRGDQLPTDGPDHTTRPKGHHSGQG